RGTQHNIGARTRLLHIAEIFRTRARPALRIDLVHAHQVLSRLDRDLRGSRRVLYSRITLFVVQLDPRAAAQRNTITYLRNTLFGQGAHLGSERPAGPTNQ